MARFIPYTKQEINEIRGYIKKKSLMEDSESNAYVQPTSTNNSSSGLASDLAKAKTQNPTDKNFVVNASDYDGDTTNNAITLDINAKNTSDAAQKLNKHLSNPSIRQAKAQGKVMANVHISDGYKPNKRLKYLRENSVKFTKKELINLMK